MPVVNRRDTQKFDVYIGRPGPWGNPYSHLPGKGKWHVATREEAVAKFREFLWEGMRDDPELRARVAALDGKILACWCHPLPCHGDVLLRAARWAKEQ